MHSPSGTFKTTSHLLWNFVVSVSLINASKCVNFFTYLQFDIEEFPEGFCVDTPNSARTMHTCEFILFMTWHSNYI